MDARRLTRVTVPLAIVAALAGGFLRAGAAERAGATVAPRPAQESLGERLWLRDCAICHGADARGSERGPSLQGVGAAGVDFMVSTGRMPLDEPDDEPTRGPAHYDPAELEALVAFAGTIIDGPAVPTVDLAAADVAEGGKHFRLDCASCHQMAGQGGILTSGRNVPPLGSVTPTQVVEAMRSGPSDMPVFPEELLDEQAATDIAAYVRELDDAEDAGGWPLGHWGPVPEGAAAFVLGLIPMVVLARRLGERNPPPSRARPPEEDRP